MQKPFQSHTEGKGKSQTPATGKLSQAFHGVIIVRKETSFFSVLGVIYPQHCLCPSVPANFPAWSFCPKSRSNLSVPSGKGRPFVPPLTSIDFENFQIFLKLVQNQREVLTCPWAQPHFVLLRNGTAGSLSCEHTLGFGHCRRCRQGMLNGSMAGFMQPVFYQKRIYWRKCKHMA